jgi:hypothetical protein
VGELNSTIPCRLCGANSTEKFRLAGFQGRDIIYFECLECGSLQTQEPTWLSDAYRCSNLSELDVGAAQRVLINHAFVLLASKICRLRTILDFGGGDGLLCRLLRDRGLDAETMDDHATPTYARRFEGDMTRSYDLITAFEVFEHLPQPSVLLGRLFQTTPRIIIASTEIYSGQDVSWWYLAPRQGQHIFFYSRCGFRLLATRYGYFYYEMGGWHVFTREPLSWVQLRVMSRVTSGILFKLFRASLPFWETWHWVGLDYAVVGKALPAE